MHYKQSIYKPMQAFRTKMIDDLNRKKKYEKIIDLRSPKLPDEFLKHKAMTTNKNTLNNDGFDILTACNVWKESLIDQGRQISSLLSGSNNNFYKIATEIE